MIDHLHKNKINPRIPIKLMQTVLDKSKSVHNCQQTGEMSVNIQYRTTSVNDGYPAPGDALSHCK